MNGRKSRRVWIWAVTGFLGIAALIGSALAKQDSHRTNFRYLTWKYGRSPYDYKWCLHLMMVDGDLLDTMEGKTMSQLRQWLPETGPPKSGSWQADWLSHMKPGPSTTYEQIGDTSLAIELEDGKVKMVFPMKG